MTSYNYPYLRQRKKTKIVDAMPKEGTWLPVSTIAKVSEWSGQMLRYMYLKGTISGVKVSGGILLLNYDQVKKLKKSGSGRKSEDKNG